MVEKTDRRPFISTPSIKNTSYYYNQLSWKLVGGARKSGLRETGKRLSPYDVYGGLGCSRKCSIAKYGGKVWRALPESLEISTYGLSCDRKGGGPNGNSASV